MNVAYGPPHEDFPAVLMSEVTDRKLAKLGWNKIEHQNTIFQLVFHFYPISGIHWTLKMPYVFKHLEVCMKTQFLCSFMKKWFDIIVWAFNSHKYSWFLNQIYISSQLLVLANESLDI